MAVPFETIKPEIDRLRDYIIGDLDYLVRQDTGGNYLAAALITCACDTLSYLKYGDKNRGERFFAEVIPVESKELARVLYEAVRDGVVHFYDTKTISIGSRKLIVNISWRAMPHFHLSQDRSTLHINIRDLATQFKDALDRFEAELKQRSDLRETFASSMSKSREVSVRENAQKAWNECLNAMRLAS